MSHLTIRLSACKEHNLVTTYGEGDTQKAAQS